MKSETSTLENMCELIVDCPHFTPKWTKKGSIVLRNQNIKGGILDLGNSSYTSEEDFQKRIKRAAPQFGDIVITREAPMGEVCLIPKGLKCCLGQRQVLLRPKKEVNGKYLFWALQSPFVRQQILWNEGTGSTVSNVRIPVLKNLNIPRHKGNEDQIADVLSSIADKIELNRQINQILETIAQVIFKSWFVDFEPVKVKIAAIEAGEDAEGVTCAAMRAISGKTDDDLDQMRARQPENYAQLKTTAELFPAAMQDAELGEMPEGWGFSKIGSELKTVLGGTPSTTNKSYWKNGMIAWINSGKINEFRITEPTAYITEEAVNNSATKLLPKRTTVLAITGATLGQVSRIEIDTCANQSVVGVIESETIPSEYIYFWIKHNIEDIISWQSGGAQQHINKDNINKTPLLIPDTRILDSYLKISKPIFDKVASNCFENLDLSQIRDALLPKLLSGEIHLITNSNLNNENK